MTPTAIGAALEHDLLTGYRPPSVYLVRTTPATYPARVGGRIVQLPTAEGVGLPDFHGSVSGRAVAFDAKATLADRWSVSHLTPEQRRHLAAADAAGAAAGVLLRLGARVWWLPWPALALLERGEGTLHPADCDRLGREVRGLRWWEAISTPTPGGFPAPNRE